LRGNSHDQFSRGNGSARSLTYPTFHQVFTNFEKKDVKRVNLIEKLWKEYKLPMGDALHYASGESYEVVADSDTMGGMKVLEPFNLEDDDPDWITYVDGLKSMQLDEGGWLWGGEGSHGSQGFFARLHANRSLVWAVFFDDSNPFLEIHLSRKLATFRSTSGVVITVDIDDPRIIILQKN
jgi:hypothetical protein